MPLVFLGPKEGGEKDLVGGLENIMQNKETRWTRFPESQMF